MTAGLFVLGALVGCTTIGFLLFVKYDTSDDVRQAAAEIDQSRRDRQNRIYGQTMRAKRAADMVRCVQCGQMVQGMALHRLLAHSGRNTGPEDTAWWEDRRKR